MVIIIANAAIIPAAIFLILVIIDLLVFAIPNGIFSDAFVFCRIPLSDLLLITVNRDGFGLAG